MATAERPHSPIYVSYDPGDKEWAEVVTTYLRQAKLEATWQQYVRFSDEFERQAHDARKNARVFILLVSNAYLVSGDIQKSELSQIREMARSGQARVIYVILENCPWRSALTTPSEVTVVIPKEDRVLEKGSNNQRRQDLEDLVQEVRRVLERMEARPVTEQTAERKPAGEQPTEQAQEANPAPVQTKRRPKSAARQTRAGARPPQTVSQAEQSEEELEVEPEELEGDEELGSASSNARAKASAASRFPEQSVVAGSGVQTNAPIRENKRLEPTPTLAQRLATKFTVGNYQAMATLISPTVLVTPAHVVEESQLLAQDAQTATIEFLGVPEQPQRATLLDVDESSDFAVLQLDHPVTITRKPVQCDRFY